MRAKTDSSSHDERFDLEYALSILTMLLIGAWMYTDSISPVFITLFILWLHGNGLRKNLSLLVVGVLIFANYLLMWQPSETFSGVLLSLGFYALALLWLINVILLARQTNPTTVPASAPELAA
jgi:hypothetical protein